MTRRDLLVAMLQAFFLALFPWLRTERGLEVVKGAIEGALSENWDENWGAIFKSGKFKFEIAIKGYELPEPMFEYLRRENEGPYVSTGPVANFLPIKRKSVEEET
jgi:hypothetical protein